MDIQELQERAAEWNVAYKPKRKRTPEYTIAHITEELGEAVADWRADKIDRTFSKDRFGLDHPKGLGSEIADAIVLLVVFADMHDLDIADDIDVKLSYLEAKLEAKNVEEGYVPWHG
jgi:NTP pyrophosphatase (non-canonical NTP hydrolase)